MRAKFSEERFDKLVKKTVEEQFCAKNILTERYFNRIRKKYVYKVCCNIDVFLNSFHIEDIQNIAAERGLKLDFWSIDIIDEELILEFVEKAKEQ